MQQILFVLFQIDESCRYIKDGRIECLRLALILLDNAIELQMVRKIDEILGDERQRKTYQDGLLTLPFCFLDKSSKDIATWEPISSGQIRKINRYFDEKVDYLSKTKGIINRNIAYVIKYLHRYRNETHHRAVVRRETISTATSILLEINCELLGLLKPSLTVYSSNEEYGVLSPNPRKFRHLYKSGPYAKRMSASIASNSI